MTETSSRRRTGRLDAVRVRCAAALVLGVVSLLLVARDTEFSLLPLAAALALITHGKSIKGRNAPPITFLVLIPLMVVIVVLLIQRA